MSKVMANGNGLGSISRPAEETQVADRYLDFYGGPVQHIAGDQRYSPRP